MTSDTSQVLATVRADRPEPGASDQTVRITSPPTLIQVVPHLLGFQPDSSLVVIGTAPPRKTVRLTLRYDLPDPPDPEIAAEIARHATAVLRVQGFGTATAVGYGPEELAAPVLDRLRDEAGRREIELMDILRVDARSHRYWSRLCDDPDCCPPDGTPYDPAGDPGIARCLAGDSSKVLASREALALTVAPCGGDEAASMVRATLRAEQRLVRLVQRLVEQELLPGKLEGRRAIALAGIRAVQRAIRIYRAGDAVSHNQAAWLAVVLRDLWTVTMPGAA